MRLIDADALMEKEYSRLREGEVLYRIPLSHVDAAPAIDPIHAAGGCYCRECVNNTPDGNGKPYCRWLELYTKDLDFFCRDGQRKIETVLPINDAKDESLEADYDKHPSNPM